MIGRAFAWLTSAMLAVACEREQSTEPAVSAQFGIFFGGQIQKRDEVPFELDPTKQSQGFRVELDEPARRDLKVHWEVTRPDSEGNSRFVTLLGDGSLRAGQRRFEQTIRFEPGDPLGLWNVRVVLEDRVVIDRPFSVYDEAARERALARDGGR